MAEQLFNADGSLNNAAYQMHTQQTGDVMEKEKEVQLQCDTDHSNQFEKIALALAKAQSVMQAAVLNKTAKVRGTTKNGGSYEYEFSYADLNNVWDAIRKPLTDNGISVVQIPYVEYIDSGNNYKRGIVNLLTMLVHESGQFFRANLSLMAKDDAPQSIGSAITYARRYGLSCLAGISCEADDDGNSAQGNAAEVSDKNKGSAKQPEAAQESKARARGARPRSGPSSGETKGTEHPSTGDEPPPLTDDDAPGGPVTSSPEKAEPQSNGSGMRPMADAERNRLGLINSFQHDVLTQSLIEKKISKAGWKMWLKQNFNVDSAAAVMAKDHEKIMAVINSTPEVINAYAEGK